MLAQISGVWTKRYQQAMDYHLEQLGRSTLSCTLQPPAGANVPDDPAVFVWIHSAYLCFCVVCMFPGPGQGNRTSTRSHDFYLPLTTRCREGESRSSEASSTIVLCGNFECLTHIFMHTEVMIEIGSQHMLTASRPLNSTLVTHPPIHAYVDT